MKNLAIRTPLALIATSLLAFGAAGCPETPNPNATAGYCDGSGCFECDANKHCWQIPNSKCGSDTDCSAGAVCTSIGCALPCSVQSQCGDNEICVTGYCAPAGFTDVHKFSPATACQTDAGCEATEFCESGKCVPRCKSDDDCGPDSVCAPCGKCQPKGKPATCGASQNYCSEQVSCGTGKSCVNNLCRLQCKNTDACPVGQICSSGLCIDDPSPAKPACVLNRQCDGGLCINGYCHDACATSVQCGNGELCQMSICQPDFTPAK